MDGWIILDKPVGMNSRKAGAILSRMFGAKTFGHIGTLDPMASGLILIGLGNATKVIPYLEHFAPSIEHKEYLFGLQFGFETDTLDITGRLVAGQFPPPLAGGGHEYGRGVAMPSCEKIVLALPKLIGNIMQVPPNYSAVHVGGRRAHKLARAGVAFEIPPRPVEIFELELTEIIGESWQFRVVCSPGTYVRSLGRDIAALCGTLGTVDMIRRIQTNGFNIKDAVALDFLENLYNNGGDFKKYLKSVDFGLGDIPVWNLNDNDAILFKNGGFIGVSDGEGSDGLRRVYSGNKLVGIGRLENKILKPSRIITPEVDD